MVRSRDSEVAWGSVAWQLVAARRLWRGRRGDGGGGAGRGWVEATRGAGLLIKEAPERPRQVPLVSAFPAPVSPPCRQGLLKECQLTARPPKGNKGHCVEYPADPAPSINRSEDVVTSPLSSLLTAGPTSLVTPGDQAQER